MKRLSRETLKKTQQKVTSGQLDLIAVIFIILLLSQTLIKPQTDLFLAGKLNYTISYLWLSSPVIFLYLLFRFIKIPVLLCGYITISLIFIVDFINSTKTALTGQPLSFNDLISGTNISVAARYLTLSSISALLLIIACGVILFIVGRKITTTRKHRLFLLLSLIIISPFSFTPYYLLIPGNTRLHESLNALSREYNILYFSWDWPGNVRSHGLPMHLIQTSLRKSVPGVTDPERILYASEKKTAQHATTGHKTIIYILCESCWYNEEHFIDKFTPLFNMGFTSLRATSPVYGAGTANAEFEMLTGLPSNSDKLSGIIYQEYADLIKSDPDTLASALRKKGFITYAAHNNNKEFWRRDVIYEKFGFDVFQGFSEMGDLPPELASTKKSFQWQPDDYLLYRSALNAIRNAKGEKIFLNLITMSTHGPFQHINDSGEGVYSYELNESIQRIKVFTEEVEKIDPDAVILIYGDHKPALNKYFYENKVLAKDIFSRTGTSDEDFIFKNGITAKDFGDVPVLIKSRDLESVRAFKKEANNAPFFCVTSLVDKYFINSGLTAFNYNAKKICNDESTYAYEELIRLPPDWLYALALFED